MKNIFAAILAAAMIFMFTGCSRFGPNDNPPMLTPAADDRNIF